MFEEYEERLEKRRNNKYNSRGAIHIEDTYYERNRKAKKFYEL